MKLNRKFENTPSWMYYSKIYCFIYVGFVAAIGIVVLQQNLLYQIFWVVFCLAYIVDAVVYTYPKRMQVARRVTTTNDAIVGTYIDGRMVQVKWHNIAKISKKLNLHFSAKPLFYVETNDGSSQILFSKSLSDINDLLEIIRTKVPAEKLQI